MPTKTLTFALILTLLTLSNLPLYASITDPQVNDLRSDTKIVWSTEQDNTYSTGRNITPTIIFSSTQSSNAANNSGSGKVTVQSDQVEAGSWPMAAANPQRTSWTSKEVRGALEPLWFKLFGPYISQKVQIIAANDTLYISTARGLYALDAETGAERWVYPTELPLGHSPTITNNVAYVGGFDRKIHAINAQTGEGLWTFDEALAGFHTNPLVVGDKVYAGNRDGTFYAVYAEGHPQAGELAWKYQTGGPILFSAAYQDGFVFFTSNDSHAYALNAQTGVLAWKSAKLPGLGFHSWWPVIYRDRVIFSGSKSFAGSNEEREDVYPNSQTDPRGTLVGPLGEESGDWVTGTPTIDATRIVDYFSAKPWHQTVFVLDRFTGEERETAPVLWTGSHSGSRYPPVVGADGVLYQQNNYMSDPYIPGGQIAGWKIGTPFINVVSSDWAAIDEPQAYSAGGNLIYWNLCCDRQAGAFDITIPNTTFADRWSAGFRPPTGGAIGHREWFYFNYNLDTLLPGYNIRYYNPDSTYTRPYASFSGPNGVYGFHGDTNPPIPYKGKVYMHRSNAIIAFGDSSSNPVALPMAETITVQETDMTHLGPNHLKTQLVQEIQKILDSGHLRPGYANHGLFNHNGEHRCGDDLVDYWHQPSETIYTLIQALPYLSSDMQQSVRSYLQNEFTSYLPYEYNHIGWQDGAAREIFDLPPEIEAEFSSHPPEPENYTFKNSGGWQNSGVWGRNPYMFYAMWKYAGLFGGAQTIFNASKERLEAPPVDEVLLSMPNVHNAFIAGYLGYLELERLAGYPESSNIRSELNRLLQLRSDNFTKDSAYGNISQTNQGAYCRTMNVANNFMFLVPELAQYLNEHALDKVQEALNEYYDLAPYWFVTFSEEGFAENAINPLYDSHSLFMAKALILQEPGEELEKYLDVPGFYRGDLFYIQKLIATLENQEYGFTVNTTPSTQTIDPGGVATYTIQIQPTSGFTSPITLTASAPPSLTLNLTPSIVTPPEETEATLTLTHNYTGTGLPGLWFTVPITATGGGITDTTSVRLLVGGVKVYLPVIFKN